MDSNSSLSHKPPNFGDSLRRNQTFKDRIVKQISRAWASFARVIPPKISGVQKWNFLGKISEDIYDEDSTVQRRADYGCPD
jgi:hypothetical protein